MLDHNEDLHAAALQRQRLEALADNMPATDRKIAQLEAEVARLRAAISNELEIQKGTDESGDYCDYCGEPWGVHPAWCWVGRLDTALFGENRA